MIAVCAQDPFRENTIFEEMYHVQTFMEYSVNVTDTQLRDVSITSSSTTQSSQVLKKMENPATIIIGDLQNTKFDTLWLSQVNSLNTYPNLTNGASA